MIEARDPAVSLDLMTRAFFETGATVKDLAEVIFGAVQNKEAGK